MTGRLVTGRLVTGRFVTGRFVTGRFVTGRFVTGRFVTGRFVTGRFVTGRPGLRRDEGQITLLVLGYALIVLALVLTAASASAVHLTRHRLLALADGAALGAADALDRQRFYAELGGAGPGPDQVVALSAESVRTSVTGYLAAAPSPALADVAIADPTGSPDGFTAEVTLVSQARLPLLPAMLGQRPGVDVRVTARARARQTP